MINVSHAFDFFFFLIFSWPSTFGQFEMQEDKADVCSSSFDFGVQHLYSTLFFISSGDTLGGHLDDMEADWTKPIVSLRYNSTFFSL